MSFLVDSASLVSADALHTAGSVGIMRYVSRDTAKAIKASEYEYYTSHDLGVGVVFEDEANRALKGYEAGKEDAQFSLAQALAAGMPKGRPIRFAIDFDTSEMAADVIDAYCDGWGAVMGRELCGPYGSFEVVERQHQRGFLALWQTVAWSRGQVYKPAQIYQSSINHVLGEVGVDFNTANVADWGQWNFDPQFTGYLIYATSHGKDGVVGGPFEGMDERDAVMLYDKYRRMQTFVIHPHRDQLDILKNNCLRLADRLYHLAWYDEKGHKRTTAVWAPFYRGERYQGLIKRAHGDRVVH